MNIINKNQLLDKNTEEIILLLGRDPTIGIERFASVDDFSLYNESGVIKNDSFALNCLLNSIIDEFGESDDIIFSEVDEEELLKKNGMYFSSRTPDEIANIRDHSRVSYGLFSGYVISALKSNYEGDINVKEILSLIENHSDYNVQEDYGSFEISDKEGNYLCDNIKALNEFFDDFKDDFGLSMTDKEKEVRDSLSYMSREDVLNAGGYEIICESPFEIKNINNEKSYISKDLAIMVYLEKHEELKNHLLSQTKRKFKI